MSDIYLVHAATDCSDIALKNGCENLKFVKAGVTPPSLAVKLTTTRHLL
jgi:hypothetical protein